MKSRRQKTIGFIILGIGLLILMDNLNIGHILNQNIHFMLSILWPIPIILWGIKRIDAGKDKNLWTYILLSGGTSIFLGNLATKFPTFQHLFKLFFPAAIIGLGLLILLRPQQFERYVKKVKTNRYTPPTPFQNVDFDDSQSQEPQDYSYTYKHQQDRLFDTEPAANNQTYTHKKQSKTHVYNSKEPKKYRRINNRFSSNTYILKEKDIPEGDSYIEINTTMGETYLTIPRSVNIKMDGNVSIGEIKFINKLYDGLSAHPKARYTAPDNATKTVNIQASVSVGEIYIIFPNI